MINAIPQNKKNKKERKLVNDFAYIKYIESKEDGGRVDIILKKKKKSLNDMTEEERESLFKLLDECRDFLFKKYNSDGYEIEISLKEHTKGRRKNLYVSLTPRFEQNA